MSNTKKQDKKAETVAAKKKNRTPEQIMQKKITDAVSAKRPIRDEDYLLVEQAAMAACAAKEAYKSLKKLEKKDENARIADIYIKQQVAMSNLFLTCMRELGLTALAGRFVKTENEEAMNEKNAEALQALIAP